MKSRNLVFYVDDSGTRRPNRVAASFDPSQPDWFALGGVLVDEKQEIEARRLHRDFCDSWSITAPLHSSSIRSKNDGFYWLRSLDDERKNQFFADLQRMFRSTDVIALACVIDRPGYDARYREQHGRRPWHLCKTAFSILAERACKFAAERDVRLRIYVEKTSRKDDERLRDYFRELRGAGMPFDEESSKQYQPLPKEELAYRLLELRFKEKTSPMIQLADIFLWPQVRGGYFPDYRPYLELQEDRRLAEQNAPAGREDEMGVKYSCFELVRGAVNTKA